MLKSRNNITFIFTLLASVSFFSFADVVIEKERKKEIKSENLSPEEQLKYDEWHRNFLNRTILLSQRGEDGIQFVLQRGKSEKYVVVGEDIFLNPDHHGSSSYHLSTYTDDHYNVLYKSSHRGLDGKRSQSQGIIEMPFTDPLFIYAYQGDSSNIRKLVDSGINIDSRNPAGMTPVMMAAYTGQLEVINTLIELGADLNARQIEQLGEKTYERNSALYISKQCPSAFMQLLEQGFDPWFKNDKYEPNLLESREVQNSPEMFSALLEHEGFDPESETAKKAYLIALDRGPLFTVAGFINNGMDVNKLWNRENQSYPWEEIMKLKKQGIDVNTLDDGETSIERLSRHQNDRKYRQDYEFWMISQSLIKAGADSAQYKKTYSDEEIDEYIRWIIKRAPVADIAVLLDYGILDPNMKIKTGGTTTTTSADGESTTVEDAYPFIDYINTRDGRHNPGEREQLRQILLAAGANPTETENQNYPEIVVTGVDTENKKNIDASKERAETEKTNIHSRMERCAI